MRLSVIAAVCLSAAGLVHAAGSQAAIKMRTDIRAQGLAPALETFAQERKLYLIFASGDVTHLRTQGASGELTSDEALKKILSGTGLTYRFIDDKTVSILPVAEPAGKETASLPFMGAGLTLASAAADTVEAARAAAVAENQAAAPAEASKQTQKTDEDAEMLVTGSRLRTNKSASPVIIITQEDIRKQGLNTVEDIIRSLPQNFSTINAAATLDNSINPVNTRGQSAIDLRGLGPSNTLVLVNGRRRAGSTDFTGGVVNINTIPAGSIERIEIITDGASAVYGSDAVAGVINFILKRDYQGGESRVRSESSVNDGDSFSIDQSLGKSWSTGNVTLSARYTEVDGVNSRKAGFTTSDFRSLGGGDMRSTSYGQPGVVSGLGSLPVTDDGTTGIAGKLSNANRVPYDSGSYDAGVTSGSDSLSFNINGEQEITGAIRAYAEVSYADNHSKSVNGPPVATSIPVPTTNRFNNLGVPVTVSYAFVQEFLSGALPRTTFSSDQESIGLTLGAKLSLPASWTADVSAGRAQDESYFNAAQLNTTLVRERASGLDASGNPLPAAQHLNLFGNGTAQNPAALAGLISSDNAGFYIPSRTSTVDTAQAIFEGPLLKLPGGQLRVAAGAELRAEDLDFSKSPSTRWNIQEPGRDVKAAFAEISVPLVGEGNRVRGVHSLDLFAAARREEFTVTGPFDGPTNPFTSDSFAKTSPKFGIGWNITPGLKLRSTLSSSFRAPQLYVLFLAETGPYNDFLTFVDPQFPNEGITTATAYFLGNPAVGPETSDNFTSGVDWLASGMLEGLSMSLTYSDIHYSNRIIRADSIARTQPDLLFELPGLIERGPDGHVSRVNLTYTNLAVRDSRNVDLMTTYDFQTGLGDITLGFNGTYAIELEDVLLPGAAPVTYDGTQNGPEKHKWRSWVSWSRTQAGANVYVNHSGRYINTAGFGGRQPVDGYTTFDVNGFYRFERFGWTINGGVRNITNARFPFFNGFGPPWDPRRVDTRGRTMYLEVTKKYNLFH